MLLHMVAQPGDHTARFSCGGGEHLGRLHRERSRSVRVDVVAQRMRWRDGIGGDLPTMNRAACVDVVWRRCRSKQPVGLARRRILDYWLVWDARGC